MIHLAVRRVLDPIRDAMGWSLDPPALLEIDRILEEHVRDPVGPELAPPTERAA